MSDVPAAHRQHAPDSVRCAVLTISDTRTLETDSGGATLIEHLENAGHQIAHRQILKDEPQPMRELVQVLRDGDTVDAILITGGTGISNRDQTFETIAGLLDKTIPGYGELFRMLSYHEIGAATILSRAIAGTIGPVVVATMPGSPAAVRLAMEKIILPEIGHLVAEARR